MGLHLWTSQSLARLAILKYISLQNACSVFNSLVTDKERQLYTKRVIKAAQKTKQQDKFEAAKLFFCYKQQSFSCINNNKQKNKVTENF